MKKTSIIIKKKILVVGDVMLDEYYHGSVNRISPEAPVPVFLKKSSNISLGGAANVAVNLSANGQNVTVMAIVGNDYSGNQIKQLIKDYGINIDCLLSEDRPTTRKIRLLANNNQQVIRIDEEDTRDITDNTRDRLLSILKNKLASKCFDLIILSDYLKGLLTFDFTQEIIKLANEYSVKVLVDVKDSNAEKYKGAYLVKPNVKELYMLTDLPTDTIDQICQASNDLLKKCKSEYVLTTCGADGMVLINKNGLITHLNSAAHEVYDVTGAGDTVIAFLAMGIANGMTVESAMYLANDAAGIQVSKVGTSIVTMSEVNEVSSRRQTDTVNVYKLISFDELSAFRKANKNKKIIFTNGCFDILHTGHIRLLKKAAAMGDILVLGLNSDDSVKKLKGPERPINDENDRFELLAAFDFIDKIVIFSENTPINIIKELRPDIIVKGGDYTPDQIVGKDFVESYGGKVVVISLVEGKSTTSIIKKIKG